VDEPRLVTQIGHQSTVLPPPVSETVGHRRHQALVSAVAAEMRGRVIEARAEPPVPLDVVTMTNLGLKKVGEDRHCDPAASMISGSAERLPLCRR
jgi:hypothetical protein